MEREMVYRGDASLVHVEDGMRAEIGDNMADQLQRLIRNDAMESGRESWDDALGFRAKRVCPGCYMTIVFNMAVTLAKDNGQSLTELGNTLAMAFKQLAEGGPDRREDVEVVRDDSQEPAAPEPTKDDLPYLDGFMPNDDPILAQRTLDRMPVTERDFIVGLTSYGLDMGLLR